MLSRAALVPAAVRHEGAQARVVEDAKADIDPLGEVR